MSTFKGVVLALVGTAWAFFWVFIFGSITDHFFYDETRLVQAIVFFVMLLGIVPFSFGISRLTK
jgi:hypothetical protein